MFVSIVLINFKIFYFLEIFVAYREDSEVKQEVAEPVPSEADLARKRREDLLEQYRVQYNSIIVSNFILV